MRTCLALLGPLLILGACSSDEPTDNAQQSATTGPTATGVPSGSNTGATGATGGGTGATGGGTGATGGGTGATGGGTGATGGGTGGTGATGGGTGATAGPGPTLTASATTTATASATATATASATATATATAGPTGSDSGAGGTPAATGGMGGMPAAGGMEGAGGAGTDPGGEFTLISDDLEEGGEFPPDTTCEVDGFNNDRSVHLEWSGAPEGTQSFAVVFMDQTLVEGGQPDLGYHHVMWGIPADVTELPAGLPDGAMLTDPVTVNVYSSGTPSYLGPCPDFGGMGTDLPHTYVFTLYAMPEPTLELSGDVATRAAAIEAAAIGSTTLTGTSSASPP